VTAGRETMIRCLAARALIGNFTGLPAIDAPSVANSLSVLYELRFILGTRRLCSSAKALSIAARLEHLHPASPAHKIKALQNQQRVLAHRLST